MIIAPAIYVVAGLVMPYIISFLKRENWSPQVNLTFSMLLCLVAVIASMGIAGTLVSVAAVVKNASTVWAAAQAFYQLYFANTATNAKLSKIGSKN